jgi:hypothetical protein
MIGSHSCPRCGKIQLWDEDWAEGNYKCPDGLGCSVMQPIYDIGNYGEGWLVRCTTKEPKRVGLYTEVSKTFKTLDGAVNYVKAMMDEVK